MLAAWSLSSKLVAAFASLAATTPMKEEWKSVKTEFGALYATMVGRI